MDTTGTLMITNTTRSMLGSLDALGLKLPKGSQVPRALRTVEELGKVGLDDGKADATALANDVYNGQDFAAGELVDRLSAVAQKAANADAVRRLVADLVPRAGRALQSALEHDTDAILALVRPVYLKAAAAYSETARRVGSDDPEQVIQLGDDAVQAWRALPELEAPLQHVETIRRLLALHGAQPRIAKITSSAFARTDEEVGTDWRALARIGESQESAEAFWWLPTNAELVAYNAGREARAAADKQHVRVKGDPFGGAVQRGEARRRGLEVA